MRGLGVLRQAVAVWTVAILLGALGSNAAHSRELVTYLTGDTPAHGQVVFKVDFDSAVKDSAKLTIAAIDATHGAYRLDNIDFVPGSKFSEVIVTAQTAGDGALVRYNVVTGAEVLPDVVASTSGASATPAGVSRPASILPNAAGTHYYYTENQFGFDGPLHRMMRVPIGGFDAAAEVVYDGAVDGLVQFSGVEIVGGRMYFFAHDPVSEPAGERQLYSVALDGGTGLATPASLRLEVTGLDRSSAIPGVGPGISDGSDEMDFDPSTGLLYGTNNGTGEVIGFDPFAGGPPIAKGALPFLITGADVAGSATTDDGLGLLAGVVTVGPLGPLRQIDGIRPDGDGHLVVVGHNGVIVSIDIDGVLADGATDDDIIRLFNRDVPTAGMTIGFARDDIGFDDHTILVSYAPEPSTVLLALMGLSQVALVSGRRRNRR